MTPRAILETVLYADDLPAAERFYTTHFGLEVVARRPGQFVFMRCGPGMLLIFDPAASSRADPSNPIPRHGATGPGHMCFAARDGAEIERWRDRLEGSGLEIEADHRWPSGARSIYLRDPAGNSIEIGEPKMWAPAPA